MSQSQMQIDGYEIKGLPIQTDQNRGRQWIRPGNESDVIKPAAIVDSISGQRYAYGGSTFVWPMVNLSPKMVNFLHEEFFNNAWAAYLTVQTFNRATGLWEAYQAVARWPDYASEAELAAGGYNNFKIAFVNCSKAPKGPDLVTGGNASGAFTLGGTGTYIVTVSNIGDSETFSSINVVSEIIDNQVFISQSGFGWSFYWSEDGLTYYLYGTNPPGDNSQIKFVKWVYNDSLDTLGSAYPLYLTVRFTSTGLFSNDFVVNNIGDVDDTNNTITFNANIQESPYTSGFDEGFGLPDHAFDYGFTPSAFGLSLQGFTSGFSNGFGPTPEEP